MLIFAKHVLAVGSIFEEKSWEEHFNYGVYRMTKTGDLHLLIRIMNFDHDLRCKYTRYVGVLILLTLYHSLENFCC